MNDIDDVQRAMWVISGKCKGCGCTVGDALEIHIEGCKFDKDHHWREELKTMLLNVNRFSYSFSPTPDGRSVITYKGQQLGKSVVNEMMNEFYKSF